MNSFLLPSHLVQARLRGLYVITHGGSPAEHIQMAAAACRGGAAIIQLRAKDLSLREALQAALQIRQITTASKVLFIINDRIDLALAAKTDGVHLGDDDIPAKLAREVMGRHAVIGVSVASIKEADAAHASGATYLGVGAIFATSSKADAGAPIGLEQLRNVATHSQIPVAAIGGIDSANIKSVIDHGANMACVISTISTAKSENEMTDRVRELVKYF
ncbi:MAG: thiamine phosphate synthase [Abditibacteriaceae bacterium]